MVLLVGAYPPGGDAIAPIISITTNTIEMRREEQAARWSSDNTLRGKPLKHVAANFSFEWVCLSFFVVVVDDDAGASVCVLFLR